MTSGIDLWEGCPDGWQRVMATCERGIRSEPDYYCKFLGRG